MGMTSFSDFTLIIENTNIIDIIKNADCQAKKWKRFGVGGIKKGGDRQNSPP
jgi:hypothetical protein